MCRDKTVMSISVVLLSFVLILFLYKIEVANLDMQVGTHALPSLKMVFIVTRHGNRRPLNRFPNENDSTENDHYGLGELTTFGRVQMYNLGRKIRDLYNGFINETFNTEDLYATSTSVDRTIMSGQVFLAGLYPPTGFQLWNDSIFWQPIPLHTDSLDTRWVLHNKCLKFKRDQSKSLSKYNERNKITIDSIRYLKKYTGLNMTKIDDIVTVWENLVSQDIEGDKKLPCWAQEVYPQPLKKLMEDMTLAYISGTKSMDRLATGNFFKEIITGMEKKIDGALLPDRKLYFFSAHDFTLVTLQAVLGTPKNSIISLVSPGSALVYELHQHHEIGIDHQFSVKVFYIDGADMYLKPLPLHIPGCGFDCNFNAFVEITREFLTFTSYDEECKVE